MVLWVLTSKYMVAPAVVGGWWFEATITARKWCDVILVFITWVLVFPGRQEGRTASLWSSADFDVSVSLQNLKLLSSKLWNWVPEHKKYNQINHSKYWTTRSHIWSDTFDLKNQRIWVGNHQLSAQNMNSWNSKYIFDILPTTIYYTRLRILCGMLCSPNTLYRNTIGCKVFLYPYSECIVYWIVYKSVSLSWTQVME